MDDNLKEKILVMKTYKQLTIEDYQYIDKLSKVITMDDLDTIMEMIASKYGISKQEAHNAMKISSNVINCI